MLIGSLVQEADRRNILISALMLAGMCGILENNLNAWHNAALETRILCRDASAQPATTFEGVPLFQNGFQQCVEASRTTGVSAK